MRERPILLCVFMLMIIAWACGRWLSSTPAPEIAFSLAAMASLIWSRHLRRLLAALTPGHTDWKDERALHDRMEGLDGAVRDLAAMLDPAPGEGLLQAAQRLRASHDAMGALCARLPSDIELRSLQQLQITLQATGQRGPATALYHLLMLLARLRAAPGGPR